jgi:hypothetical protein
MKKKTSTQKRKRSRMNHLLMTNPSKTGEALDALLQDAALPFLINWTGAIAEHPDFEVLNEKSRTNKLAQLIRLDHQGVKVVPYSLVPMAGWLPRTRDHQQGRDFTDLRWLEGDFWTYRIPADDEWRLHFFKTAKGNMRLLRSGIKLPRVKGFHPWVRSHRLGWKISYTGGAPKAAVEEARKAMQALDLDFGAVDVLVQPSTGEVWVLEVNTCPGLDSGTLSIYANSFLERGSYIP